MSVSGIGESTLADVDAFCAEMDARSVPVSLLVAPRMRDDYRLDRDPRTVDWLTGRRAAGDALVLQATTKRPPRGGAANSQCCAHTRPTCG